MMDFVPYRHKVQYYETDGMRVVHHSNYIRFMEEAGVTSHTETRCTQISGGGVTCVDAQGSELHLEADTVILCAGMQSRAEVRDQFAHAAFQVRNIGDCVKPRIVKDAIHEALDAALTIS